MKEIDLLSLSEVKTDTKKSTTTSGEKKESASLFDSLLSQAKVTKDEKSGEETKTKETAKELKNSDTKSIKTEKSEKEIDTKTDKKSESADKKVDDKISTESKENAKAEVKTESKSISLLDRMVLEAKKTLKSEGRIEEKTQDKSTQTKQNIEKDGKTENSNNGDMGDIDTVAKKIKKDDTVETSEENRSKKEKKEEVKSSKNVENPLTDDKIKDKKTNTTLKTEINDKLEKVDESTKDIKTDTPINEKKDKNDKSAESLEDADSKKIDKKEKDEIKTVSKTVDLPKNEQEPQVEAEREGLTSSNIQAETKSTKKNNLDEIKENKTSKEINTSDVSLDKTKRDNKSEFPKEKTELKNDIKTLDVKADNKTNEKTVFSNEKAEKKLEEKVEVKIESKLETKDVKQKDGISETSKTDINQKDEKNIDQRVVEDKKEQKITEQKNIVDKKVEENSAKDVVDEKVIDSSKEQKSKTSLQQNTNSPLNIKNEKVANELSKLNTNEVTENKKIDISLKDESKTLKKDETKVTLDKLVDDKKSADKIELSTKAQPTLKQELAQNIHEPKDNKNELLSNIYLSSQKNSINNQNMALKHEGVKTAKDAKGVDDIKKSAKLLDLAVKEVKIEVEESNEKDILKTNFLNRVMLNKNSIQDSIQTANINMTNSATATTATTTATNQVQDIALAEETQVNINVAANTAMSIQNRIIGARQQMSSMMSDVARSMYENYKPPVTAFRINLLPAQLGSIAILMKNDRENGLNISLSISNSNTLDAFTDNESGLKSALTKNFGENTEFSLDFSSGDNSNAQEQTEQQQGGKREPISSNDILDARSKVSNTQEQDVSNYM